MLSPLIEPSLTHAEGELSGGGGFGRSGISACGGMPASVAKAYAGYSFQGDKARRGAACGAERSSGQRESAIGG